MTRRPPMPPDGNIRRAHQRMAPGGRLWSESPVKGPAVRVVAAGDDPPQIVGLEVTATNTAYSYRNADQGTTYTFQTATADFTVAAADIIDNMRTAYPGLNVLVAFQAWWFVSSAGSVFYDTGAGWEISTASGSEDAVGYGAATPNFPGLELLAVQDAASVTVDGTVYTMRLGMWWADSATLGTPETIDTSDLVGSTAQTAMMILATAGTRLEVYDQAAYPVNTIPGIPYDHVVALMDDYVYWPTGNTGSGPMYASITTPGNDYTDPGAGMGYVRAVVT